MRLTATIRKEAELFVAQAVEVDVASQGASVEEAMSNLKEALELYFEDGGAIDIPSGPTIVATVDVATATS